VTRFIALAAAALAASTTLAAAAPPLQGATTEAGAVIVQLNIPGQDSVSLGEIAWPSSPSAEVQSFAYPDDGSVVRVGLSRATVSAQRGQTATAQAHAETIALSLFGGSVVASQVISQASAGASRRSAGADVAGSGVEGLRVLDQDAAASPGTTLSLADWGTLEILSKGVVSRRGSSPAARGTIVALRVRLSAAHAGLPAGTEIVVGSAHATAAVEAPAPPTTNPRGADNSASPRATVTPSLQRPPEPEREGTTIPGGPVRAAPPDVTVQLSGEGFVFPVYGSASFGDSFGGPRPDVPGGWHHGEDIFAPVGTPLLAVASGTLHSIGWNDIGGYRLWLRDGEGNEFYYAHLSAYSPLAVEGNGVEAGDVIGFVGNTGDAEFSAPHLHFEIHPAAMVGLGYDGVVAPYPFLLAWRRAEDIFFAAGRVYVPSGPGATSLPPPGAVLLEADDIASTSGLVPGGLEHALTRKASP
jgi:murein DD-endopeptidase MepM/ murein hydrolase activator NlpD